MVESTINYLAPMSEKPYYYLGPPPEGEPWRNTKGDPRTVPVHDARTLGESRPESPTLDRQGFRLVSHQTRMRDFYDHDQVREIYYPEIEKLVGEATGATRVLVFDHNVRNADRAQRGEDLSQNPVLFVHCDYTETSGPQRVRDLAQPAEVEDLLEKRYAVINAWRPIRGPIVSSPLAVCDAQTIQSRDLMPTDLKYPDRTGEIYSFAYSPEHRWYYYPRMETHEVLLLKCFDSDRDGARFTAHTAFDDPTTPAGSAARESIEARTLVFF